MTVSESTEVTIADLHEEIRALRESHDKILVLVAEIKDQVGPTIDALKSSPIMKMLGV